MAISGTITLSTASTNMSTFDLYPCTSSSNASCSVTAFETNVTRSQLLNGFVSNVIPDGTTYIKINPNTAGCLNQYIIVELSGAPTCSFDATIVYGLPSVTLTPTPTQTQTPTGISNTSEFCFEYSVQTNYYPSTDCVGYNDTMDVYTFIVKDMDGNPIMSPTTFDIIFSGTTGFQGGGGSYNGNFTFNQGDTSSEHFVWVDQAVDGSPGCPCPCSMSTNIDTFSIAATNIVGGYVINNCSNNVTQTPTPTPTPTIPLLGQCYTYTLDHVSDTAYGVGYKPVGSQYYTNNQFNSIPSVQISDGVFAYSVCSEIEPTLLDTSNWPSTTGISGDNGISRTGPDGSCNNNFDCYSSPN